ncbi:transposase [Geobacillus sp. JS12]|uniref:transposase n=1 Tax=Geobacillus sp. JS12 TaxID=1813182 RepID=UPI001F378DE6|nr:transposase [Geobacillus sp. JS12]
MGFFETYVKLSDEEEQQLRSEVEQMETKEKERVLELIISYEQKGKIEGREEGREEGRKEGAEQEKRDIAKRMLMKGFDAQTIHELTGLPVAEIGEMRRLQVNGNEPPHAAHKTGGAKGQPRPSASGSLRLIPV